MGYDYTLDALIGITDANGLVTRSTYDHFGRPEKSWNEATGSSINPNERFVFGDADPDNVPVPFFISYTTMLSNTTGPVTSTYALRWYDGRGRVIQDVTAKDTSNTSLVDTFYNDTGQVVSSTLPYTGSYSYPPTHTTIPNQPNVSKVYDGIGRTTVITNPDGTSILNEYWQMLWVREVDEARNQHKWTHTDLLGRVDEVFLWDFAATNPAPPVAVDYAYDMLNRLLQTTRDVNNPNQTVSSMYYDEFGRKSAMDDPNMGSWSYKYDQAGNITEQQDPLCVEDLDCLDPAHHIFFEYDNMSRIAAKYYGTSHHTNGIADVKYYYDNALGDASTAKSWNKLRRAEITLQGQGADKANGHDYLYDTRGLLVSEAVTTSLSTRPYTTTYKYDEGSRLYSMTYPDPESTHEVVKTFYNAQGMGMPYSMTTSLDSVYPVWSAQYNIRGQMTQLVQGTAPYNNAVTTNFGYDDTTTKRGWLNNTTVVISGTEKLNLTMGYSVDGNITSVAQSAGGTDSPTFNNTYTYDPFDRLKSAASAGTGGSSSLFATEVYTFDGLSRMITRTVGSNVYPIGYSPNTGMPVDGPTSYNGMTYGYDAVGNQITRTTTLTSKGQTRTFDAENRLTKVISDTTSTNSSVTEYIYGPNGERVIKTVQTSTNTGDGPASTTFDSRTLYVGSYEEELPNNKPVTWASKTNTTADTPSNILRNTGGSANAWDAGAISTESIASTSGGGFASVVVDSTSTQRIFGLGNANTNATQSDVEFGLILRSDGTLGVMESGTSKGTYGAYYAGDVLKVAVVSGSVKYYRNSSLLYTSLTSPSYPLYLDTSFYTSNSTLAGGLLCAGSQCVGAPEYASYYSFGNKLVGMRRVNAVSGNGQFRIVGDHLGSTTLIVDTSASPAPNVVQRQYHKPYGETAWQYTASSTGGESLTNIGFTKQRTDEDSSGLMFYNARLYDPVLSAFVSADIIAADRTNPLSRNRYSYVTNNPLRYADPTGHCKDSVDAVDRESCDNTIRELRKYGLNVANSNEWTLRELALILESINDLMHKAGWSISDFRHAMGITNDYQIDLVRQNADPKDPESPGEFKPGQLLIYDASSGFTNDAFKRLVVHELAHAWDYAAGHSTIGLTGGYALAQAMAADVGAYDTQDCLPLFGCGVAVHHQGPEMAASPYGSGEMDEDWAEAVTAVVYGDVHQDNPIPGIDPGVPRLPHDSKRAAFVNRMFFAYCFSCRNLG
jgi:RHS repeat-associated protein